MTDDAFARLPDPPYWAVVFSSRRRGGTGDPHDGYPAAADRMVELAAAVDGFLGVESARDADGFGITVSYWTGPEAIRTWRLDAEHALVRATGRRDWYDAYELRVARVERGYGWRIPDVQPGPDLQPGPDVERPPDRPGGRCTRPGVPRVSR